MVRMALQGFSGYQPPLGGTHLEDWFSPFFTGLRSSWDALEGRMPMPSRAPRLVLSSPKLAVPEPNPRPPALVLLCRLAVRGRSNRRRRGGPCAWALGGRRRRRRPAGAGACPNLHQVCPLLLFRGARCCKACHSLA